MEDWTPFHAGSVRCGRSEGQNRVIRQHCGVRYLCGDSTPSSYNHGVPPKLCRSVLAHASARMM